MRRLGPVGVSGSQNCNLELSHAHIRDEESYDSPGGQFPARPSKFPARLNKFAVRRELIPCFILQGIVLQLTDFALSHFLPANRRPPRLKMLQKGLGEQM